MDVCGAGVLTHDEVFRLYKLMFGAAISDDHILSLTFLALKHPDLIHPGEITKNEFLKVSFTPECRKLLHVLKHCI